jgi:hypothetical protein
MSKFVAAALTVALAAASFADEPKRARYKVGEQLEPLFREYRVTGPGVTRPGQGCLLVCTYSTRPVVMVYTREITPAVVRLIKKLDEATDRHKQQRLGSYVVLLCKSQDREKELKALAEKEKIERTLLSLVVLDKEGSYPSFRARFGPKDATVVILATAKRQVKACHAFPTKQLRDSDVERILADLSKILPEKK